MAIPTTCRAFANAFLLLAALTLPACAPQHWWTYQNNPEHTGYVRGGIGIAPSRIGTSCRAAEPPT
jgi:hypothetical protein